MKIGISEFLVLASCVFSFSNMTMATVALSLGVFGGLARFAISHSEKQEKAKSVENAKDNIATLINSLASGMNSGNRENLH